MRLRRFFFLGVTLLLAGPVGAAEVIALSEIAPGSTGVCLTEMDGGELVEIPLTVLGVQGPSAPEREMLLVRLDDARFEHTGIIAGMSGSPVYIDGKLAGALAFGWSFSKDPIGGVTPFTRMQQLAAPASTAPSGAADRPDFLELLEAQNEGLLGDFLVDWLLPARSSDVSRLPLVVSAGHLGAPSGWLREGWSRLGWVPAQGAAASSGAVSGTLRPGSMVAAVLVDGDATIAAGGTVTEVRGDQVWAFGHSFLGGGIERTPMALARVVTVLPSVASSFKFFAVGEQLGAFEVDRTHGIWGRIGPAVPMVPVEVTVDGRDYSFRSIRHPTMLPLLVGYLTNTSLAARGRSLGDQTAALEVLVGYGGRSPVRYEETFTGPDAATNASAITAAVVGYLENSSFSAPEVAGIEIRLETSEQLQSATLVDAVPDRRVVRPGETIRVRLRLRPWRGVDESRMVDIEIPSAVAAGKLDLVVADGASWTVYDLQMRPSRPASFDQELALLDRLVPSTRVVLALERKEVGVTLPGGNLSVPPSIAVQLRSGLGPNLETTTHSVLRRIEVEAATPVSGAVRIPITVKENP